MIVGNTLKETMRAAHRFKNLLGGVLGKTKCGEHVGIC